MRTVIKPEIKNLRDFIGSLSKDQRLSARSILITTYKKSTIIDLNREEAEEFLRKLKAFFKK